MKYHHPDDSLMLHTDLYQINMAKTYWQDGIHERKTVFDLYFRKLPFKNGYAIFAGLEKAIHFLNEFRFTDSDLKYLREELEYDSDFIDYLA
ncbi:nicotinate phosphoribosyltransferase, partial [Butyricicoccus sp. 1XD8-22]